MRIWNKELIEWESHNQLKKDFLSVDYVGYNRYVLDIRGNNYRLVAVVVFIIKRKKLMVRKFENITFTDNRALYDKVSEYGDALTDEATANGALDKQGADQVSHQLIEV